MHTFEREVTSSVLASVLTIPTFCVETSGNACVNAQRSRRYTVEEGETVRRKCDCRLYVCAIRNPSNRRGRDFHRRHISDASCCLPGVLVCARNCHRIRMLWLPTLIVKVHIETKKKKKRNCSLSAFVLVLPRALIHVVRTHTSFEPSLASLCMSGAE